MRAGSAPAFLMDNLSVFSVAGAGPERQRPPSASALADRPPTP